MEYAVGFVVGLIIGVVARAFFFERVTIFEYERGLKYVKGKFVSILLPGRHKYWTYTTTVRRIDVRPRFVSISGQEVLSSDGVTLKASLAANYEIADPNVAINKVKDFEESLYLELQLALRQIIGAKDIDAILSSRDEIAAKLVELTDRKIQELGLRLITVNLKDIMFPGQLKQTFAQVVNARKEGLAALEKARGETAALRSLANVARLLESNPSLLQLRLLQSVGASSGNTLILGLPPQTATVPIRTDRPQPPHPAELPGADESNEH